MVFKKGHKINLGKHWKIKDTSNMGRKKGCVPWNKGVKFIHNGSFKKGHKGYKYWKGKTWEEIYGEEKANEIRNKITFTKGELYKDGKLVPWNKGLKGFRSGEKNNFWKGGVTPLNHKIRNSLEYKEWIKRVFERDNYTCLGCGNLGGNLEIHHIKPFALILKENNINTIENALICKILWNIQNGITLCPKCHAKIDKYRAMTYSNKVN